MDEAGGAVDLREDEDAAAFCVPEAAVGDDGRLHPVARTHTNFQSKTR